MNEISSDGWQKYFKVVCFNNQGRDKDVWAIFYGEDSEKAGWCVPRYGPYRTQMHAERGARRAYRKMQGEFERIVLLGEE